MSEREAARQFGLARETVRKMLRYSIPPGYRRQQPARRPKLDAWAGIIDQILEQDKAQGKKQRHTAKRIFERLRDEHAFPGGYTIVKDYVRLRKLSQREMFVPLAHPPGDAQADFGEAQVVIAGVERKAHYLVVDLPQPDDCFVMAFPKRPVFYAIGIIITAYLPIFTLQSVEGRLFKPMAWTVAFALLGALIFSMLLAPVLSSLMFRQGTREWHNPVLALMTSLYRIAVRWAIDRPRITVGVAAICVIAAAYLATSGLIGSEFLPHLDEGAIWVRGTLAPSTGPGEGIRLANQARVLLASFPEVTVATSQVGRPDDGTDTTGFFNTEYFVDLKPKDQWRPVFHQDKEQLIAAMNRELVKIPGVIWNFSQPIADNMEEAVSGVKGELAIKVYGDELKTLEETGDQILSVMRRISGIQGKKQADGKWKVVADMFNSDLPLPAPAGEKPSAHPGKKPSAHHKKRK